MFLQFLRLVESDSPGGGHVTLLQLRLEGVQLVQQLLLVSLDLEHVRVQERVERTHLGRVNCNHRDLLILL